MEDSQRRALRQRAEYERRLAAGENPAPLVARIDLEELAGSEHYRRISELEQIDQNSETCLRGQPLVFHTPSRRLLWQALGQEYIEPELLDYIDDMEGGSVFYDIGASNGIFALYAAVTGKQVIGFEPEIENFALLNRNTYLNRQRIAAGMSSFNIALSSQTTLGRLFIKRFEAGGHLKILDRPVERGFEAFEPEYVQAVMKYRLDDFIGVSGIPRPNHLKIDVDGCELEVMRGMSETLADAGLRSIFIELEENNEQSEACRRIIEGAGFHLAKKKRVQNYFGENNCVFRRPG